MKKIEDMLRNACKQDFDISNKVEYRINYTINNLDKNNNFKYYLKKFATAILSIILIMISSVSVYAAFGGKIDGKNIFEWVGIKFSNKTYEKYKENIEDILYSKGDTSVILSSAVCDEGFTILEFDVKLSEEDKNYLKIGKDVVPDDYLDNDKYKTSIIGIVDGRTLTQREVKEQLMKNHEGEVINKIWLSINNDIEKDDENNIYIDAPHCNMNIIVDNIVYHSKHNATQIVNKISDYEYKVYQMYFLTDEQLGGKDEFAITINDIAIGTDYLQLGDYQRNIYISEQYNIKLSKNKVKENITKIYPNISTINYGTSTQSVQEITITPMLTIIKISAEFRNVNSNNLSKYITPLTYEVFNETENKITSEKIETKKQIIYPNGKIENWPTEDIYNDRSFYNAIMKLEEYVIIENNNNNIKIKAFENNNYIGSYDINLTE